MAVSGEDIVNAASKEIGDPYVFGATGPNSFDCSGLVEYVFHHFGIKTPRIAADQAGFGTEIPRAKIQPGDLIFFDWDGHGRADHVGIYAGNGEMIHAPHTGTTVKRVKLSSYYWSNEVHIRRFPGVTGGPASSDGGGILGAIGDAALSPIKGATGALEAIGSAARDMATSAASVGKVADAVTRLFLPSSILRGAMAVAGTGFLLIGIFFLSREARQ